MGWNTMPTRLRTANGAEAANELLQLEPQAASVQAP
jgi:hypothetical protein